ncbi:MAG: hypothetical protein L0Y79_11625 [Chlorobi bacterium]|nr:hypothetical protein [Chlorobiota bacterium]MCI0715544.1 hypothetical protein [Chlorobiota bacterium]
MSDTLFLLDNQHLLVGQYEIAASSNAMNYNNTIKRIYIKPRNNYNNNSNFRYYGDIRFY